TAASHRHRQPRRRRDDRRRRQAALSVAAAASAWTFDIGVTKLAIVGGITLIVIGPERLPRVARMVGTMLGRAQRYVADVKAEVNRSIELEELNKMKSQFEGAAREVHDTVQRTMRDPGSFAD